MISAERKEELLRKYGSKSANAKGKMTGGFGGGPRGARGMGGGKPKML